MSFPSSPSKCTQPRIPLRNLETPLPRSPGSVTPLMLALNLEETRKRARDEQKEVKKLELPPSFKGPCKRLSDEKKIEKSRGAVYSRAQSDRKSEQFKQIENIVNQALPIENSYPPPDSPPLKRVRRN